MPSTYKHSISSRKIRYAHHGTRVKKPRGHKVSLRGFVNSTPCPEKKQSFLGVPEPRDELCNNSFYAARASG